VSKRYQILVEAIIAQNEEQKKSFEKSLSSQAFKDLTLKISKVQLDENAVASLQKQIQEILKNAGFDLAKLDKLKKNVENATKDGLSKGATTGANAIYKEVQAALFKAGESFNPIKNQLNEGYEISGVKAVYDEKDTALLKGYNVELQKTAGNIRTITTNFVAADQESNRLFGDMVSKGQSSNEILNQVTASAGEAAQKFSSLQALINQGYRVTGATEKFGIDEEGNSVLQGYNVQLERVRGNLKEVATGYVEVDAEGGEFLRGIKATGKEVTDVASKVAGYSETLKQLKAHHAEAFKNKEVQKYGQELESTINAFGQGTKKVSDVTLATKKLNGEIETVEKSFHTATTATEDFISGIKTALNKIAMWGLGTAIIYGALRNLKEAIQYVKDLNKELINIQIVTGMSASSVKKLAQDFNDLASEMGATTLQVAQGSVEWYRQGKTVEETSKLLKATLMLSKLGNMESAQATEYLTSTLNGFKLEAEDAILVVDKLIALDNQYATSAGELAEALQRTANSAQQAGFSFDEIVSYITVVSSVSRKSAIHYQLMYI
jgi:uncharacterized protein YukE